MPPEYESLYSLSLCTLWVANSQRLDLVRRPRLLLDEGVLGLYEMTYVDISNTDAPSHDCGIRGTPAISL